MAIAYIGGSPSIVVPGPYLAHLAGRPSLAFCRYQLRLIKHTGIDLGVTAQGARSFKRGLILHYRPHSLSRICSLTVVRQLIRVKTYQFRHSSPTLAPASCAPLPTFDRHTYYPPTLSSVSHGSCIRPPYLHNRIGRLPTYCPPCPQQQNPPLYPRDRPRLRNRH